MVIKKRLKKFLIIALIVVTVVWAVALYLHIQAHNRYIQDGIEGWIAMGFDEDFIRDYVCWFPIPIYAWKFGPALVISAFIIFLAWVRVIISVFKYMLSSHKQNNV